MESRKNMYSVLNIIGLPLLYVFFGLLVPPRRVCISRWISRFLYFCCIPLVTFKSAYEMNMSSFITISMLTFTFSCLATALSIFIPCSLYNTSTKAVLTGYLNIGWFGIPIAYALFGIKGANVMVAAYMGGNLFGSTIAIYLIASSRYNPTQSLIKVLQNPSFYALGLGFLFKSHVLFASLDTFLFFPARILLSFLGMCLIGISIRRYFRAVKSIQIYLGFLFVRLFVIVISVLIVIAGFYYFSLIDIYQAKILGLIAVFPIAANIIVLAETLHGEVEKFIGALVGSTILSFLIVILGIVLVG